MPKKEKKDRPIFKGRSYKSFLNQCRLKLVTLGKRLRFDGHGIQLFGNWIKWLLLSIITIGIYSLWVPIKMKKWVTKHTFFVE